MLRSGEDVDIVEEDVAGHWSGYRAGDDTAARAAYGYARVWSWTRTSLSGEELVTKRVAPAKAKTPYAYTGGEEVGTGRFYGMTEARIADQSGVRLRCALSGCEVGEPRP